MKGTGPLIRIGERSSFIANNCAFLAEQNRGSRRSREVTYFCMLLTYMLFTYLYAPQYAIIHKGGSRISAGNFSIAGCDFRCGRYAILIKEYVKITAISNRFRYQEYCDRARYTLLDFWCMVSVSHTRMAMSEYCPRLLTLVDNTVVCESS